MAADPGLMVGQLSLWVGKMPPEPGGWQLVAC